MTEDVGTQLEVIEGLGDTITPDTIDLLVDYWTELVRDAALRGADQWRQRQ